MRRVRGAHAILETSFLFVGRAVPLLRSGGR